MGDQQSRPGPVLSAPDVGDDVKKGEEHRDSEGQASQQLGDEAGGISVPSESEILASLVTNLGQSPSRSLALSDIRQKLPPALRRLVEDTEVVRRWLSKYRLFEVTGPPGQEYVSLVVGKPVPPGDAGEASSNTPASTAPGGTTATSKGTPPVNSSGDATATQGTVDEESSTPSMVQLRGLPFRATVAEIKVFLGEHARNLASTDSAITLLLTRDGRPSGFARVQLTSPEAAKACREELHKQPMGDRYVEVLECNERAGKARRGRVSEAATAEGAGTSAAPLDSISEAVERERVLQECRDHMRMPGQQDLLLSMLGIALSLPARTYLRRVNLGLKHFLARFPTEFRIEGPKGCERVVWCESATLAPGVPQNPASGCLAEATREPSTPKLAPSPLRSHSAGQPSGHCMATPSDWGTPGAAQQAMGQAMAPGGALAASGHGGCYDPTGSWGPYGWPPPWAGAWPPWPQWQVDTSMASAGRGTRTSKRSGRTDGAPAARSHAHLHPQSHPFAHRPPGANATASGAGAAADGESKGANAACLRLRGLPFNMTEQDVLAFFAQHDMADRIVEGDSCCQLLPKANGRPSGQAVVQMRTRYDAEVAQRALYNQWVDGRYIEVFAYGGEDPSEFEASGAAPVQPDPASMGILGSVPWGTSPWAAGLSPPPLGGMPSGLGETEDIGWGKLFSSIYRDQPADPSTGFLPPVAAASPQASVEAPARAPLQV